MDDERVTAETIEYEKPEIVDYGDLVELTAGSQSDGPTDQTHLNDRKFS